MLREKLSRMSEGILIHEAKRKRAKAFGEQIEAALDFEEARMHAGHIRSATYNRISFGFIPSLHEYFFQELILGDQLSSFPYIDRIETHKGEIVHTKIRTDGQPVNPNLPLGVSRRDLKRIGTKLESLKT